MTTKPNPILKDSAKKRRADAVARDSRLAAVLPRLGILVTNATRNDRSENVGGVEKKMVHYDTRKEPCKPEDVGGWHWRSEREDERFWMPDGMLLGVSCIDGQKHYFTDERVEKAEKNSKSKTEAK